MPTMIFARLICIFSLAFALVNNTLAQLPTPTPGPRDPKPFLCSGEKLPENPKNRTVEINLNSLNYEFIDQDDRRLTGTHTMSLFCVSGKNGIQVAHYREDKFVLRSEKSREIGDAKVPVTTLNEISLVYFKHPDGLFLPLKELTHTLKLKWIGENEKSAVQSASSAAKVTGGVLVPIKEVLDIASGVIKDPDNSRLYPFYHHNFSNSDSWLNLATGFASKSFRTSSIKLNDSVEIENVLNRSKKTIDNSTSESETLYLLRATEYSEYKKTVSPKETENREITEIINGGDLTTQIDLEGNRRNKLASTTLRSEDFTTFESNGVAIGVVTEDFQSENRNVHLAKGEHGNPAFVLTPGGNSSHPNEWNSVREIVVLAQKEILKLASSAESKKAGIGQLIEVAKYPGE